MIDFCKKHAPLPEPLGAEEVGHALGRLRTLYKRWPFFRTVIDNLSQVLAKTDLHIAANYAALGEGVEGALDVFHDVEREFQRTARALRDISGERKLLAGDPDRCTRRS